MRKICFALLFLMLVRPILSGAQNLDLVPPVTNSSVSNDSINKFIVSIHNGVMVGEWVNKYANSIQIIKADSPWPPIWYTYNPIYTREIFGQDSAQGNGYNFKQDCMPSFMTGNLSFLSLTLKKKVVQDESFVPWQYKFVILDHGMNIVDTISSPFLYGGKYSPDLKTNDKIEKLWKTQHQGKLNLSRITGNPADTAILSLYWTIDVLDKNNKTKWSWNPIYDLPEVMQVKEKIALRNNNYELIKWSEIKSFQWDGDGNILYSLVDMGKDLPGLANITGIGKISRKGGSILWKKNFYGKPTNSFKDSLVCYRPSELKYLGKTDTSFIYSLCDLGHDFDTSAYLRFAIFEHNSKTNKLNLIKYIYPNAKFWSDGHGSLEYNIKTREYIFEYGLSKHGEGVDTASYKSVIEYGKGDSTYTVYRIPKSCYTFGIQNIGSWPVPPQPVIKQDGQNLMVVDGAKKWDWYSLEGQNKTIVKWLGTKATIKPKPGATYCVVTPYGIGYSVSKPYTVLSK